MAYTSGLLKHRVTSLNRGEAQPGKYGLDSAGIDLANFLNYNIYSGLCLAT
jgi:hypothetical protein